VSLILTSRRSGGQRPSSNPFSLPEDILNNLNNLNEKRNEASSPVEGKNSIVTTMYCTHPMKTVTDHPIRPAKLLPFRCASTVPPTRQSLGPVSLVQLLSTNHCALKTDSAAENRLRYCVGLFTDKPRPPWRSPLRHFTLQPKA
jgi:hypothetical protein